MRTAPPFLVVLALGCQPADRLPRRVTDTATPPPATSAPDTPRPPDPDLAWQDKRPPRPTRLIEFVHEDRDPAEWNKLPQFWNPGLFAAPDRAAAVIGL